MSTLVRSCLLLVSLVSVVWGLNAAGCNKWEDCEITGTCGALADSLVAESEKLGRAKASECERCLNSNEECLETLEECGTTCKRAARCYITADPEEYNDCLFNLKRGGFSDGQEDLYPWEGEIDPVVGCLHACREKCGGDPWACVGDYGSEQADRDGFDAVISARNYSGYALETNLTVADCRDNECRPGRSPLADGDQLVHLSVRPNLEYFEIKPEEEKELVTYFYPGYLPEPGSANDAESPMTVYVLTREQLKTGNGDAGLGHRVLEDRAQSVILPDSCIWQQRTAGKVTLRARPHESDEPLVSIRCEAVGSQEKILEDEITPCVWYSSGDSGTPDLSVTESQGYTGGIAGLKPGLYDIAVCDVTRDPPELVSLRRDIDMRPGAFTVVRTWPLTTREKNALSGSDKELCQGSP